MTRNIKVREVSRKKFERKMKDLDSQTRLQIQNAMNITGKEIIQFFYGRIPGKRVYKIVYSGGMTRVWNTRKM